MRFRGGSIDNRPVLLLAYKAYTDVAEVTLSEEHEAYQWLTKEELEALDLPDVIWTFLNHLPE